MITPIRDLRPSLLFTLWSTWPKLGNHEWQTQDDRSETGVLYARFIHFQSTASLRASATFARFTPRRFAYCETGRPVLRRTCGLVTYKVLALPIVRSAQAFC